MNFERIAELSGVSVARARMSRRHFEVSYPHATDAELAAVIIRELAAQDALDNGGAERSDYVPMWSVDGLRSAAGNGR